MTGKPASVWWTNCLDGAGRQCQSCVPQRHPQRNQYEVADLGSHRVLVTPWNRPPTRGDTRAKSSHSGAKLTAPRPPGPAPIINAGRKKDPGG